MIGNARGWTMHDIGICPPNARNEGSRETADAKQDGYQQDLTTTKVLTRSESNLVIVRICWLVRRSQGHVEWEVLKAPNLDS